MIFEKLTEPQKDFLQEISRDATIIWDFDGVVADSEPLHRFSYQKILQDLGNDTAGKDFNHYMGHPETEIWELMKKDGFKLSPPVPELIKLREDFFLKGAMHDLQPTWVIKELGNLFGNVCERQVIVSNGQPFVIAELVKKWNLDFLEQLRPQDLPGKKRQLLRELWAAGKTVTVEDGAEYLKLASEAGSHTVAIRHSLNLNVELLGEIELEL